MTKNEPTLFAHMFTPPVIIAVSLFTYLAHFGFDRQKVCNNNKKSNHRQTGSCTSPVIIAYLFAHTRGAMLTRRLQVPINRDFPAPSCSYLGTPGYRTQISSSVTVPGYQGNLSAAVTHSANIAAWERFGIEFILTFVIVFVYFVSMDTYRKWISTSSITLGATYSACTFVSMPYLNPARSLGPSFVLNRWESHWVYWIGPIIGGIVSGLTYEFILNPNRQKQRKESTNGDCSSIRSDEDAYDDLDKQVAPKFDGSSYNTYRAAGGATGPSGYCPSLTTASLYSAPPAKLERVESLYGGTKSLYCKSPPLTRANLNRSQSVYTKSNSGVHRDVIPKPGPLVPAQSLYPMRLNQTSHVQNQNVHNQLQQRSESIYGVRGVTPGTVARTETYGGNGYRNGDGLKYEEKAASRVRPESVYGLMGNGNRRGQSAQSDDSSYGSYHGSSARNNGNISTYAQKTGNNSLYGSRGGNETKQSPSSQLLSTVGSSSYHHSQPQESPNSHY